MSYLHIYIYIYKYNEIGPKILVQHTDGNNKSVGLIYYSLSSGDLNANSYKIKFLDCTVLDEFVMK